MSQNFKTNQYQPSIINETFSEVVSSEYFANGQTGFEDFFSAQLNNATSLLKSTQQYITNLTEVKVHKRRNINNKLDQLQTTLIFLEAENKKWKDLYERETSIHLDSMIQTVLHTVNKSIDKTLNEKLEPFINLISNNPAQQSTNLKQNTSRHTQTNFEPTKIKKNYRTNQP